MNHQHECQFCGTVFECKDPECQDGRDQECEYCFRDGERDLSADVTDYDNWI